MAKGKPNAHGQLKKRVIALQQLQRRPQTKHPPSSVSMFPAFYLQLFYQYFFAFSHLMYATPCGIERKSWLYLKFKVMNKVDSKYVD